MRFGKFNFAIGVALSVVAHALFWLMARHLVLPGADHAKVAHRDRESHVRLVLNDDSRDSATAEPELPEDEMGESGAKGTGAQPAKGEQPLVARHADQEQPFTGVDRQTPGRGGGSAAVE